MYKVQKKDGRLEDFDRNKVVNGVMKSGATAEEAEKVAMAIDAWLPTATVGGVVNVLNLRGEVLETLKMVNSVAAANFEAYRKAPVASEVQSEVPVEVSVASPAPAVPAEGMLGAPTEESSMDSSDDGTPPTDTGGVPPTMPPPSVPPVV